MPRSSLPPKPRSARRTATKPKARKPSNSSRLGAASTHLCVMCGKPAQSWQHRVAEGRGGPTDLFNCVPMCGDGTRGCHGWAESNVGRARELGLDVPGQFVRGRYEGRDAAYRAHYNGEVWDSRSGWVKTDGPVPVPMSALGLR